MYSRDDASWHSSTLGVNYWMHGAPKFTLDEAKAVWDYILEHFPTSCLAKKWP